MSISFKNYIKSIALQKGYDISDIARFSGLSLSAMYNQLNDPDLMRRDTIRKIHKYLGIEYIDLIEGKN